MTRRLLTRKGPILAAGALALAAPAPAAGANTFVSKLGADTSDCGPQANPCLTVATGISHASSGAKLHIGPGHYTESVTAKKALTLVGAGSGTDADFDPLTQPFVDGGIRLTRGGGVRSLRVAGTTGDRTCTSGIELAITPSRFDFKGEVFSYAVSHIVGRGGENSSSGGCPAIRATDTSSDLKLKLDAHNTVAQSLGVGVWLIGGGVSAALSHHFGGDLQSEDSHVTVTDSGLKRALIDAGDLTAVRTTLTNGVIAAGFDTHISLRDTAVATRLPGEPAADLYQGAFLDVVGSTLVAAGGESQFGAGPNAGLRLSRDSNLVGANLVNTIVRYAGPRGQGVDILASGGVGTAVTASSSSYSTVSAPNGASVTPAGSAGNVIGDPGLTDPAAGDVHLLPSSPLIDRGDSSALQPGERDADGRRRSQDGDGDCKAFPDIGAFERSQPKGIPCARPILSKLRLIHPVFRVGGRNDLESAARKPPRGTAFEFKLSKRATVEFNLFRKRKGRRVNGHCVRPSKAPATAPRCTRLVSIAGLTGFAHKGQNSLHFSGLVNGVALHAGNYRAVLVAVDADGNRSTDHTISFRIARG